jgi:hypothetical protein
LNELSVSQSYYCELKDSEEMPEDEIDREALNSEIKSKHK